MKKLTSILAVALMALGLTTYVVQNNTDEFNADNNLACDNCETPIDRRDPPKLGIAMNINDNVADEFKFMKNDNSTLACDNCENPIDRRDPPKLGIAMNINDNAYDEFKFMKNDNSTLACDNCENPIDRRDPPKIGIV